MNLIKKINQYLDNNWQEFILDADTLNLAAYSTQIQSLEEKNSEQDTAISAKVDKSGDTITGDLEVLGGNITVSESTEEGYSNTTLVRPSEITVSESYIYNDSTGEKFTTSVRPSEIVLSNLYSDGEIEQEYCRTTILSDAIEVAETYYANEETGEEYGTYTYMSQYGITVAEMVEDGYPVASMSAYDVCITETTEDGYFETRATPYGVTTPMVESEEAQVDRLTVNTLDVAGQLLLSNSPTTPDTYTVTDAYTIRVTAKGEQEVVDGSVTEINEIKGKTKRYENLIPFPYKNRNGTVDSSGAQAGVTYTYTKSNGDGVITANGTADATYGSWYQISPLLKMEPTTTYFLSGCPSGGSSKKYRLQINGRDENGESTNVNYNDDGNGVNFKYIDGTKTTHFYVYIYIAPNVTVTNLKFKPLLVEGNVAGEWQTPFTDLKHAYINAIKSTGSNLINPSLYNFDKADWHGISLETDKTTGTIIISGELTDTNFHRSFVDSSRLTNGETYTLRALNVNGNEKGFDITANLMNKNSNSTVKSYADKGSGVTFIIPNDGDEYFVRLFIVIKSSFVAGTYTVKPMLYHGTEEKEFELYREEIYQLPETLKLGEWDSFNPQTGELVRQTETITFDGSSDERWVIMSGTYPYVYYDIGVLGTVVGDVSVASRYEPNPSISVSNQTECGYRVLNSTVYNASRIIVRPSSDYDFTSTATWLAELKSNPWTVSCKLTTPIVEKIPNTPVGYTVYNNGSETIIQGDIDNSIYGAIPTITQTYSIHENPTEAANKAYVNNGLAKKLDKTGGTITGNLVVEGKTDTELGAIVSRKGNDIYGLTYDGDAYKLGQGTIDEKGDFDFLKDENGNYIEGLPVALRDDSSTFDDGELVMWSAEGNKFVSTGVTIESINKVVRLI